MARLRTNGESAESKQFEFDDSYSLPPVTAARILRQDLANGESIFLSRAEILALLAIVSNLSASPALVFFPLRTIHRVIFDKS